MITFTEQIVWIFLALNSFIAGAISFRMYRRLPIQPYFYQTWALFSFGFFGFFAFFGRAYGEMLCLQTSGISFGLAVLLYMKFFIELFGNARNYSILYLFCWIMFGFSVHCILWNPPIEIDTRITFDNQLLFSFLTIVLLFIWVVFDYLVFSLKKIRREGLPRSMSYFSVTILGSMVSTMLPMALFLQNIIPLYAIFITQIIFVSLILFLLVRYPETNFLALLKPQLLVVMHQSGLKVYTHQFTAATQEDLLTGALSAINNIFHELVDQTNFERIKFQGKNIYAAYKSTFSVVYIDDEYMPFINPVLDRLADKIEAKYTEFFTHWSGNVIDFDEIGHFVSESLYFLPQLVNIR